MIFFISLPSKKKKSKRSAYSRIVLTLNEATWMNEWEVEGQCINRWERPKRIKRIVPHNHNEIEFQ